MPVVVATRGPSQRYIGTVASHLLDDFSFDRRQARQLWDTGQLTKEQCFEITYDMAKILCKSAPGKPVHFRHLAQTNQDDHGVIRKMWIDGEKLMIELEIWDDILNQEIAKGLFFDLSLTHKMDWDYFTNHIVSECSMCVKPQRPESHLIHFHKGKPGEVEIEGDEWILSNTEENPSLTRINPEIDNPAYATSDADLSSSSSSSVSSFHWPSSLPTWIMASADMDLSIASTASLDPNSIQDDASSSDDQQSQQQESSTKRKLPARLENESEASYWKRLLEDPNFKTLGSLSREALKKMCDDNETSDMEKKQLLAENEKLKIAIADRIAPFLTSQGVPVRTTPLSPYIAAEGQLPASTHGIQNEFKYIENQSLSGLASHAGRMKIQAPNNTGLPPAMIQAGGDMQQQQQQPPYTMATDLPGSLQAIQAQTDLEKIKLQTAQLQNKNNRQQWRLMNAQNKSSSAPPKGKRPLSQQQQKQQQQQEDDEEFSMIDEDEKPSSMDTDPSTNETSDANDDDNEEDDEEIDGETSAQRQQRLFRQFLRQKEQKKQHKQQQMNTRRPGPTQQQNNSNVGAKRSSTSVYQQKQQGGGKKYKDTWSHQLDRFQPRSNDELSNLNAYGRNPHDDMIRASEELSYIPPSVFKDVISKEKRPVIQTLYANLYHLYPLIKSDPEKYDPYVKNYGSRWSGEAYDTLHGMRNTLHTEQWNPQIHGPMFKGQFGPSALPLNTNF